MKPNQLHRLPAILLILSTLSFTGACASIKTTQGIPSNIKLYPANQKLQAIRRTQSQEVISCSEPKFNEYVCMSYDDLKAISQACGTQ